LAAQRIVNPISSSAPELVSYFGCVQAEEYALTKWSLGLRLPGSTDLTIEAGFNKGDILRTHLLRPTWHFVAPADIRWMLKLTAPRVNAANAFMYRKSELDSKVFARSEKVILKALSGDKYLTRNELNAVLKKHKIEAGGFRLSYIMMHAELEALICSGPRHGNQFTYALLDERVPATKAMDRQDALAELASRYFRSRGPATIKDFSTWSGLTVTDCKNAVKYIEETIMMEVVDGNTYYFNTETTVQKKTPDSLYLLPPYDELIMGYKERGAVMLFRDSLKSNPAFRHDSMIMWNGQVIGTWKRTMQPRQAHFETDVFRPLTTAQQKAFQKCVIRFSEFSDIKTGKIKFG